MDDLDCRKTFRLMMATRSSTRVKKNSKFLPLAVQLGRYFMLSQLIRDDCKSTQTAKRRMRSIGAQKERESKDCGRCAIVKSPLATATGRWSN